MPRPMIQKIRLSEADWKVLGDLAKYGLTIAESCRACLAYYLCHGVKGFTPELPYDRSEKPYNLRIGVRLFEDLVARFPAPQWTTTRSARYILQRMVATLKEDDKVRDEINFIMKAL